MYGFEEYDFGVQEYSVEDVRDDLNSLVKFFQAKDYHEHAMDLFMIDYRQFTDDVVKIADCFCVDEELTIDELPEWMQSESLGLVKKNWVTMWGRCVFPVKDVRGNVMGMVGWDPFEKPKYLDSKNYGYKAGATTLYGMEMLPQYYTNKEPVFLLTRLL